MRRVYAGLSIYVRTLRMLWSAAPVLASAMVVLLLLQGAIPPLTIWLFKLVIDAVTSGQWSGSLPLMMTVWAFAMTFSQVLSQWVLLLQASLNEHATAFVEHSLMQQINRLPDLTPFEDADFYETLQMLTRLAPYRPLNVLATTVQLVPNALTSIGLLSLVASLAWWLPLLLVLATVPLGYANLRLQQQSWNTTLGQKGDAKMMRYMTQVAMTQSYAKEIRVFQFAPFLQQLW